MGPQRVELQQKHPDLKYYLYEALRSSNGEFFEQNDPDVRIERD